MLLEHSTLAPLSGLLAEELERGDEEEGEGSSSDEKDDRAAARTFQSPHA